MNFPAWPSALSGRGPVLRLPECESIVQLTGPEYRSRATQITFEAREVIAGPFLSESSFAH